jgi:undecaprenyl-diphosphatase
MKFLSLLTPFRCRLIFAALMILNFCNSWHYLTHRCPIDLSGDEAQYWDWSRHLDLSYYSKGPMVAYIIRASCFFLGETMPAVRLPALIFAVGTSICTYWLTRKLFGSDQLALGAVLLGGIVPMYAAGGMLMTIDPPMFFFWALGTCLLAKAIFDHRNWAWPAAGLAVGLGALTKYGTLIWLPIVLLFLLIDKPSRATLKTVWPWIMTAISLLCLTPPVIWNARHDWVSFHHVATQTSGGIGHGDFFSFLGAQILVVNPMLAVLMAAAAWTTMRSIRQAEKAMPDAVSLPSKARSMLFLLVIGGSFFLVCLADSIVAKVQVNWPAPAYFTLLILVAYFISAHWRKASGLFVGALIFGIAIQPILHDLTLLYPLAGWLDRHHPLKPRDGTPQHWVNRLDMEYKLRGMADPFASDVARELAKLPANSFVLCEAYEDASELSFYLPNQPKTYFVGSYWTNPQVRRRWTQFDIWPDRALDRPELIGRDAIYVGRATYPPLRQSFEAIVPLPDIVITRDGVVLQKIPMWKCIGFKGITRPAGPSLR